MQEDIAARLVEPTAGSCVEQREELAMQLLALLDVPLAIRRIPPRGPESCVLGLSCRIPRSLGLDTPQRPPVNYYRLMSLIVQDLDV